MEKENLKTEQLNQCHPEHSEGSCKILRDVSLRMTDQAGRSMVEMLGVLAIIGVLSVMGIAGYKAAMTRHRANELLNEASKRAVVVAAQLSLQGLPTANLNEFKTNEFSGGTFSTDTITPTDGTFQIQINGVDESVCELMSGIAADNAIIQDFAPTACSGSSNTVQLTYNNDLGTGAAETQPQDNGPHCDAGEFVEMDGEVKCCRGYRADADDWTGYEDTVCCPNGSSVNRYGECVECGEGNYYNMMYADFHGKGDGIEACGKRCTKNEDCDTNSFCFMDPYATGGNTTVNPIVGSCLSLDDVGLVEANITINGTFAGRWIGPERGLYDWWSARNFCLRFGGVDLPTRQQICNSSISSGSACTTLLRAALEEQLISQQMDSTNFWLEATEDGNAYRANPSWEGYTVQLQPEESTARLRPMGVVCGPVQQSGN